MDYKRFYVTDRRFAEPEVLDEFLKWICALPENTWIHFHCRGGKGRTTTFMMIYDIWKTKASLPFETYLKRQTKIGGTDLAFTDRKQEYLKIHATKRFEMLKRFYDYVKINSGKTWSEFLKQ